MLADRRLGHHQFPSDRRVGPALRDQREHLSFTWGEPLQRIAAAAQQLSYDVGVHHCAAVRDLAQGVDELLDLADPVLFLLVLGIALLCTGISLANTMVMAASDRVRDLAVLRLAGATRRQVLRLVGAEALTVVAVGGMLGLLVTAINLGGMRGALGLLATHGPMRIPWPELATVTGACAVLAVVFSVAPAAWAMRRGAVQLVGTRE